MHISRRHYQTHTTEMQARAKKESWGPDSWQFDGVYYLHLVVWSSVVYRHRYTCIIVSQPLSFVCVVYLCI